MNERLEPDAHLFVDRLERNGPVSRRVVQFDIWTSGNLIHTRVGDGPRTLGAEEALLGSDGLPLKA